MTEMQRPRGAHSRYDALGQHIGGAGNGGDGVHKGTILPVLGLGSGHLGLLNFTSNGIEPKAGTPQ